MPVALIVWDGLRPDFIRPALTPNLCELSARGVAFDNHRAVFPSETRVNSSSIATGCRPGGHGITGNTVYVPGAAPDVVLNTGHHEALASICRARGRVLRRPTLAARLRAHGRRAFVVGAGSPGSTMLQDPEEGGCFVNTRGVVVPETLREELVARFGPLGPDPDPDRWNDTACAIFSEQARRRAFDFGLLWLCDPDYTQHKAGLGAPESLDAIRRNDDRLAGVLSALGEAATVFVGSDHGFSTLSEPADRRVVIDEAGLMPEEVVTVPGGYHLRDPARAPRIVRALVAKPWAGPVFTRTDCEGAFSLTDAGLSGPDAPDVVVSPAWVPRANEHGVPGTALGGKGVASHGSCGSTDMRASLVAAGPGLRKGIRSSVPTDVCDLAPTVLSLLGGPPLQNVDGRVLTEAMEEGPSPAEVPVRLTEKEAGGRVLRSARVGSRGYLLEGA